MKTNIHTAMKRVLQICILLALGWECIGAAPSAPDHPSLPNVDKRQRIAAPSAPADKRLVAAIRLKTLVPGLKVDWDELVGSPSSIASNEDFLSGPNGEGKAIPAVRAKALAGGEPHRAVKAFLNEHAALFGHDATILNDAQVIRNYTTAHNGLQTVVWHQHLDNIPVFEGLLITHTTKHGELVSLSSRMLPDAAKAADRGVKNRQAVIARPQISAAQAVVHAAQDIGENIALANISDSPAHPGDPPHRHRFAGAPVLNGETDVSLTWLAMDRVSMRLCWNVVLTSRKRGEMFNVLIDAQTGEALVRHSLTSDISNASYRVYTSDSPSPFSPGWATPNAGQPALTARSLITLQAVDTNASPNGWINDGDNETRGNNVDAHLDVNADDIPDLPRPQGSPNRVFDFPLDLTQAPSAYRNAAVTQLFYWCNWMHDTLYELGFTEAAGNFQNFNFLRGGLENDAVQADAQDGSGTNNANFTTPSDGSPGRMQMYIWDDPTPDRDGDLDAEIVLHEYTHGLSTRLVGGGSGISAAQTQGMGEGWSDFYALSLLSAAGDDVNGNYACGAYVGNLRDGVVTENYYYGIRRYPYTTDIARNPLTFRDIDPSQASPHIGVPLSPRYASSNGNPAEVHRQGEVWCSALWEARANIITKVGPAGNRDLLQLVTDGMRLAPANPTFLQARDAIISADRVSNDGSYYVQLWSAFAKRGMGASATSPASSTTTGVSEAFDAVIYVDKSYPASSTSDGSASRPFSTVTDAHAAALASNIIRIRGGNGNYPETPTLTKAVRLESENGQVTIGAP